LTIGAEIDLEFLASKDDVKSLADAVRSITPPYSETIFAAFSDKTNASGTLNMRIYDVPDGMTFFLYKLIQWADGFTPAAPYSNAAAWSGIFHGQPSPANLADFAPYTTGGQLFPLTAEWGDGAPEFRQNDTVFFQCNGGPVSTNITILLFGELRSLKVRHGISRQDLPVGKQRLK
jgi:hypothetical protein